MTRSSERGRRSQGHEAPTSRLAGKLPLLSPQQLASASQVPGSPTLAPADLLGGKKTIPGACEERNSMRLSQPYHRGSHLAFESHPLTARAVEHRNAGSCSGKGTPG